MNSSLLKKQIFTPDNVEKIIGWAVSHHLMTEGPTAMALSSDSLSSSTPPPSTPPSVSVSTDSVTTTPSIPANSSSSSTTNVTKTEKLEIGLKSIDYAIEMLTSNDPESKAVVGYLLYSLLLSPLFCSYTFILFILNT